MIGDEVAAAAARAAAGAGGALDPWAAQWARELVRWGWTLEGVNRGFLRLGWPAPFRALTGAPAFLRLPVTRELPEFAEMYEDFSAALGAICWMAAGVRQSEINVHAAAVRGDWDRERPMRWPMEVAGRWPDPATGFTTASIEPGS